MIIESAFLNLPELLTSSHDHRDTFESTVTHLYSLSVFMELASRNLSRPFEHVFLEKPYPTRTLDGKPIHSDLLVTLQGAVPASGRLSAYGVRPSNWFEVKGHFGSTRGGSSPAKTKIAGMILRDILRLCLLPSQQPGESCQNGRYLLIVSSSEPSSWIALNRPSDARSWLQDILSEGSSELAIDLSQEPSSLRQGVGPGFTDDIPLTARIATRTRLFSPASLEMLPVFWGYLVRIGSFSVQIGSAKVSYQDQESSIWSENDKISIEELRKVVLPMFASSG